MASVPDSPAPSTGSAVIELDGAVAVFGRFPALAGLDFRAERGEVVALLGPNGAGKTTLLRLCAGLVPLRQGSGTVLGFDLTRDRRLVGPHVGYLSAQSMLYPDLTIQENVEFWAQACNVGGEQIPAVLDRLGLSAISQRRVQRLSTGQRRRASLAAVVVRRPQLWLLDEPHAGLDQSGRDVIDGLVGDAIKAGATVLIASHELERVGAIATSSITIAGGVTHPNEPGPVAGGTTADGLDQRETSP